MWPLSITLLAGCLTPPDGPQPIMTGEGFFDRPWPDETRLVDEHPDLSDFPGAGEFDLIDAYVALAPKLDGFGTNSPLYLRFDGPLDTERLPIPADSTSLDSPVLLIDIDPASPSRGDRVPLAWDFQPSETRWQPANLLALRPVWGFPMRPANRYALVVTTDLASPAPEMADVWSVDHPDHARYLDLQEILFEHHLDLAQVALATTFRTQDPTLEMARISHRIQTGFDPEPIDQALVPTGANAYYQTFMGHLRVPIWQQGESPYLLEGGGFAFDETGWPELAGWETIEFTFTLPVDQAMPPDGWPVVIFSHGSGGSRSSFANEAHGLEPASMLAKEGLAGLSISLPFHADRNTSGDPVLLSFNYFNPDSARSSFRQAAAEQLWLAELLTARVQRFTAEDSELEAWTDPSRIAYLGHSHGGEVGALAAPFFGDRVRAVVLSGAGGGLGITLTRRDAGDFDIEALLEQALEFSEDEALDDFHPVVGLAQLLGEVTDPLNYAPFWHHQQPSWDTAPVPVLMYEGLLDIYTPPRAIEALAGAARQPFIWPVSQRATVQLLLDQEIVVAPVQENLRAWDGSLVTGGAVQYADQGHFAIFNEPAAASRYRGFLGSAMNGTPVIGP